MTLTNAQIEHLNTMRDRLLELKDQVDDALIDLEALIEALSGNQERSSVSKPRITVSV